MALSRFFLLLHCAKLIFTVSNFSLRHRVPIPHVPAACSVVQSKKTSIPAQRSTRVAASRSRSEAKCRSAQKALEENSRWLQKFLIKLVADVEHEFWHRSKS